jgi:hypothetical protein
MVVLPLERRAQAMFKNIFSNKEIDDFAKSLAASIAKRYPPSLDTAPGRKVSVNRVTRVFEETLAKAEEYNRTHKLGVYKKARLGNTFKWELKELGYSEKFIDLATEGLIVYLARKPQSAAASGDKTKK